MCNTETQNQYITRRWHQRRSRIKVLKTGTRLFHGGMVESVNFFCEGEAAWFFVDEKDKKDCERYMRWGDKPKFLLECELKVSARLAYFATADFVTFATDYCDADHDKYKRVLLNWGLTQYNLDGSFLDGESPEIFLFAPGPSTLRCRDSREMH